MHFITFLSSHDFIGEFTTSYKELCRGQSQLNVYEVSADTDGRYRYHPVRLYSKTIRRLFAEYEFCQNKKIIMKKK